MVKVHKIELFVINFEDSKEEDIINSLENNKYFPGTILDIKTKEIEWSDNHPINIKNTYKQAIDDLFNHKEDKRLNKPAYNID